MQDIDPRIDPLIDAYIDCVIDDEQFDLLSDWLREDPSHRQVFARRLATHSAITEWCTEHSGKRLVGTVVTQTQKPEGISAPYTILQEVEHDADALQVTIHDGKDWASPGLSNKQWRGAFSYLYEHYVNPRVIVSVASAAALLLGVVLAIVLLSGPDDDAPIAEQVLQDFEPESAIESVPIVATLTAEHDTAWDRRPGQDLYAGQRFSLTEGFAEITTNRGAVAILEAPATVELLDNNNALQLHSGKLVGICETPSSKGFLVRTPHMEVTDIGTKFGVSVVSHQATEAHVFAGEVQVGMAQSNLHTSIRKRYYAGQAVKWHEDFGLETIDLDLNRFSLELDYDAFRPTFAGDPTQWLGQVPADLSPDATESNDLQVYIERAGVTLERDVPMDLVMQQGPGRITAGETVDIYLLHLDPPEGASVAGTYTIRFDRPILGVAYTGEGLRSTDSLMAGLSIQYPTDMPLTVKSIDPRGSDQAVPIFVQDGTALQMSIDARGALDQVRVLVRANENEVEQ